MTVLPFFVFFYITVILNRAADIQKYQFDTIRKKFVKHNTINFVQQSITVPSDMAFRSAILTLTGR